MFKPGGMQHFDEVRLMIQRTVANNDYLVVKECPIKLDRNQGLRLYRQHEGRWYHSLLATQVSSQELYAMVIEGQEVVKVIKKLIGLTKPEEAKIKNPGSIRGQFVIDNYAERQERNEVTDNICHASGKIREAKWEISVVFPDLFQSA